MRIIVLAFFIGCFFFLGYFFSAVFLAADLIIDLFVSASRLFSTVSITAFFLDLCPLFKVDGITKSEDNLKSYLETWMMGGGIMCAGVTTPDLVIPSEAIVISFLTEDSL